MPCPHCSRPVVVAGAERSAWAPFCSKRCRLADLGAWCDGEYAVSRHLTYDDIDEADVDENQLSGGA